MNQPLGYAIGNTLEIIETVKFLKGEMMADDIKHVVLELGAYMMQMADLGKDIEKNKKRILENIENGKAYNKFLQMVKQQGGDISYLEDLEKFEQAKYKYEILSQETKIIETIPANIIAKYVCDLGAGRTKKEDSIDKQVGIVLNKKVGDKVQKGEKILTIYSNKIINL